MPASSPTRHRGLLTSATLLTLVLLSHAANGQAGVWPRQFTSTSGTFIVYQPQPEQLSGDHVTARAAFSLQKSDLASARFGVLWFQARVQIDRDSSKVTESELDVTRVRLPGAPPAEASRYEHQVEAEATLWDLSGSLDQLQAGLAASARERLSVENLDHTAPRILFSQRRALLVSFDGPPQAQPVPGSRLRRVVNTPYAVVFDSLSASYYLNGANLWYQARNPLGPWNVIAGPPAAVAAMVPADTSSSDQVSGPPPVVITATEPSELIVTDGEPLLAPLVGSQLFYVTNTESDVLREAKTGTVYVLLSGRWYTARTLDDPWVYVSADSLPALFQQIPLGSPKGNLLASVAGTDEADDALADNRIPQTSSISRDDHDVAVDWDGRPQFEAIENTDLQYALNTDAQIVAAAGRFFLCDQGVWYVADDATGPWSVSDVRPPGLDDLDPSCPVYNLRFVDIYGVTPDAVTSGYLPGYLGYYPCRGTVVYGTGYRYRAWRGQRQYFPRACTWGFQARFNPWLSRWSFGFSYASGFLRVGMRWKQDFGSGASSGSPLWLGPGGYHRPLLAEDHSMVRMRPIRTRDRVGDPTPANLYTRSENLKRLPRGGSMPLRPRPDGEGRPARRPDNVFAGSDGKVYQRETDGQWKVNRGQEWLPTPMPAQPAPPLVPIGPTDPPVRGTGTRGISRRPAAQPMPVQPAERELPPARPAPGQPRPLPPSPTPEPVAAPPPPETSPAEPALAPVRTARPGFPTPGVVSPPQPLTGSPGGLERDFRARERSGDPARVPSAPVVVPASRATAPAPVKPALPPGKKPVSPARER